VSNGKFQPGTSGNPNGRPSGSRSKVLVALDALGEEAAVDILKATIEKAKAGDAVSAKVLFDRVWPPRKGSFIKFDLPEVKAAEDITKAIAGINAQVAEGTLTLEEGTLAVGLVEAHRRAIDLGDHAARIAALEQSILGQGSR